MTSTNWRTAKIMLICGAIILAISIGIRHSFGLFLQPLSMANGWGRETFSFAIALQNLVWGAAGPFLGALADRIGAGKVILGGAVLYALGLLVHGTAIGRECFHSKRRRARRTGLERDDVLDCFWRDQPFDAR